MSSPSRAVRRNAAVRAALARQFPGVRFAVRNGRQGTVQVTWCDGPTERQVIATIRGVPADTGGSWAHSTDRVISAELHAVAYLRAREARESFYSEWTDRDALGQPQTRARWSVCAERLDAHTVTAEELAKADLVVELAVRDEGWSPNRPSQAVARTVHELGNVIDVVSA